MSEHSIYSKGREMDAIDRAYRIGNLAKLGAASTDSALNIDLEGAMETLLEVIARLSAEIVDELETKHLRR